MRKKSYTDEWKPGTVLTTESMLVEGIHTAEKDLQAAAEYVGRLGPDIAYISIPTRPPAETWVQAASESSIAKADSIQRYTYAGS